MPKNNSLAEPGELPKYSALADQLESDLAKLGDLHKQREELTGELGALKITRDRLSQSILDEEAPAPTLLENMRELGDERLLLESSLDALGPRIARLEEAIHEILPLSIDCFARLRGFVVRETLEACRTAVRRLVASDYSVAPEHLDAVAIAMPDYVKVSRITLPSLSWVWSRELDPVPMHWSSLVRPFTEAERVAQRRETIDCLISVANALLRAAAALCAAAGPYAQGDIPPFRCEAEPVVPAVVDPKFFEWQMPLGGSDADFIAEELRRSGKSADSLSDQEKEILARMVEQRHKFVTPQPMFTGATEMLGSTMLTDSP